MNDWFWIVFDTSQLMDYYRDVHNLLALPAGATMRYDYKQKYLSDEAVRRADGKESAPVLFIYMQKQGNYRRDEKRTIAPQGVLPFAYVGTRLGTMLSIVKDGESYYFDFQVGSYPTHNEAFDQLMKALEGKGETPWAVVKDGGPSGKYVCVSTGMDSLRKLQGGEDQEKWSVIVSRLSADPMQFREDAFWRLKGPYRSQADDVTLPRIHAHVEKGKTRQSEAVYHITENTGWRFELISEIGQGVGARDTFHVEASTSDDKVVKFTGNPNFPLRRYTGTMIEFRAHSAQLIGQTSAETTFATSPQPTGWVTGPVFALKHRVMRNKWRVGVGTITGAVAICTYVLGDSKLLDCHPLISILLKIFGLLFGVASVFALTGKISFSPK